MCVNVIIAVGEAKNQFSYLNRAPYRLQGR